MLVLSRQRDETIMIGDDIEITVVDIRGDKVRLGITAPTRISVHRKEVYEAIRAENQQAARLRGPELEDISPPNASPPAAPAQPSRKGDGVSRLTGGVAPPGSAKSPDSAGESGEKDKQRRRTA